jgi:hypothetical protein
VIGAGNNNLGSGKLTAMQPINTPGKAICTPTLGIFFMVSLLSIVGCENGSGSKYSAMTMIQPLSAIQEQSIKCRIVENAETAECAIVYKALAKLRSDGKHHYCSSRGSLIGVDFVGRVIVVLEPPSDISGTKWKCLVSPLEAAPAACDVLR